MAKLLTLLAIAAAVTLASGCQAKLRVVGGSETGFVLRTDTALLWRQSVDGDKAGIESTVAASIESPLVGAKGAGD